MTQRGKMRLQKVTVTLRAVKGKVRHVTATEGGLDCL